MPQLDADPSYLRFPLDLGDTQNMHFMKIKIFPSKVGSYSREVGTVCLFAPGGGINGPMQWDMDHDYEDVKLTRLGTGIIGAVSKMSEPTAIAAGAVGAAAGLARAAGAGAISPKVDVLYSNSQLRRFTFSHFMAPSSQAETEQMRKIIKILRKFSAPELTIGGAAGQQSLATSGYWFIPPAEFEISFYFINNNQTVLNTYIPKIGRCVLTKIDVNYAQQGEFSTFADGSPVSAQLSMTFREMRIISQADVDSGY